MYSLFCSQEGVRNGKCVLLCIQASTTITPAFQDFVPGSIVAVPFAMGCFVFHSTRNITVHVTVPILSQTLRMYSIEGISFSIKGISFTTWVE